jgi:hypothetical protein
MQYNANMSAANTVGLVDRLVAPLGDCLTPESARRLIALRPDPELEQRMDDMAGRHTEGQLTPAEEAEYGRLVSYATFVAILKSKARQLLAGAGG